MVAYVRYSQEAELWRANIASRGWHLNRLIRTTTQKSADGDGGQQVTPLNILRSARAWRSSRNNLQAAPRSVKARENLLIYLSVTGAFLFRVRKCRHLFVDRGYTMKPYLLESHCFAFFLILDVKQCSCLPRRDDF